MDISVIVCAVQCTTCGFLYSVLMLNCTTYMVLDCRLSSETEIVLGLDILETTNAVN